MDNMLPSPGFSIPSIGTPLHHPEEDQQILPNAMQQQQLPMSVPPSPSHMQRSMHAYTPAFATPHSMMQPQTPVRIHLMCTLMS